MSCGRLFGQLQQNLTHDSEDSADPRETSLDDVFAQWRGETGVLVAESEAVQGRLRNHYYEGMSEAGVTTLGTRAPVARDLSGRPIRDESCFRDRIANTKQRKGLTMQPGELEVPLLTTMHCESSVERTARAIMAVR